MIKKVQNLLLIILLFNSIASISKSETLKGVSVIRVIDGDTISVSIEGKTERVRFIGIQAPELSTNPIQDFALEAKQEVEKLLNNKKVILEYDPKHKKDKYKRLLADIYVEDTNLWVNGYLVQNGFAFTYILNKNPIPLVKDLISLESKAISQNLPFWQNKNYKVINSSEVENYIGNYKVVEGTVVDTLNTKKTLWVHLSDNKEKGFSLRIANNNLESISSVIPLETLKGKKVRVRGFIDKYSPKYGAFIEIVSPYMIEILI